MNNELNPVRFVKCMPVSMALWRACEDYLYKKYTLEITQPILDLGCGDGLFADSITTGTIHMGIDISISAIKKAAKLKKYAHLSVASAENLPFEDGIYNTVVSNCVLEHIPNIERVITEVRRVLKPSGKFIFTVPSKNYNEFLLGTTILRKMGLNILAEKYINFINKIGGQIHCWDISRWQELLQSKGFKVIMYEHFMPARAMHIYDFFGVFRPFMLLNLTLFGKRIILPRNLHCRIWEKTFKTIVSTKSESGGGLWVLSQKV